MRALTIVKPGEAKYIEVEKPSLRPYDVLAKVKYVGICGTDIDIYIGEFSLVTDGLIKYPVRIGHEWSGIVEEVGSEVKGLKPGDRVISDNWVSCGECEECRSGHYSKCKHIRALGTCKAWDGAYAEYVCMPFWHYHILPDNVPLEVAAVIEPATIANHALIRGNMTQDTTVMIIGNGPIGITGAGIAKCKGAKKVILAGRRDSKLEIAKILGADVVINMVKDDFYQRVMAETDGKGADLIIEASGAIDCVRKAMDVVALWGRIALVGFYGSDFSGVDADKLVNNCISMIGVGGQAGLDEVLDLVNSGKLNLGSLITHRFPFDKAADVISDQSPYAQTKLKMLVEMP